MTASSLEGVDLRWDNMLRVTADGDEQWFVAELEGCALGWRPTEDAVSEHLRRKKWIAAMLNDAARNASYATAIEAAAREQGGIALDVGAGTGLLTSLCAAQPAVAHVVAVEMEPVMAALCRSNLEDAGLAEKVTVVEAHSTAVELPVKASLIVSEIVDHFLIGEGILPSIRDALERLATPTATVIPRKATVIARLARYREQADMWGLCTNGGPRTVRVEVLLKAGALEWVSEPIEEALVLRFDAQSIPTRGTHRSTVTGKATLSATANCVVWWWTMELFGNEGVTNFGEWQDHWMQAAQTVPDMRLEKGAEFELEVSHDDEAITFGPASLCSCGWHLPEVSDARRRTLPDAAAQETILSSLSGDLVDVGDWGVCALIGAKAQLKAVATAKPASFESFRIIRQLASRSGLDVEIAESAEGGTVCAEPRYRELEGQPLWTALRYWRRAHAAGFTKLSPSKARVECVALSSDRLRRSYGVIMGDHAATNRAWDQAREGGLLAFDEDDFFAAYQAVEVSSRESLAELNFAEQPPDKEQGWQATLTTDRQVDAVAITVVYENRPLPTERLVAILEDKASGRIDLRLRLDPATGATSYTVRFEPLLPDKKRPRP